jgi:hypothetical protein
VEIKGEFHEALGAALVDRRVLVDRNRNTVGLSALNRALKSLSFVHDSSLA